MEVKRRKESCDGVSSYEATGSELLLSKSSQRRDGAGLV